MYLSYVDESGKPNMKDPEKDFVLIALTINEKSWNEVNEQICNLKKRYFPDCDISTIELHATDIMGHKRSFKNIPLKVRLNLYREIMEFVAGIECFINIVIVRKELLGRSIDVNQIAIELLYRLSSFIKEKNCDGQTTNHKEYGLLIIDSVNTNYDNKTKAKIRFISDSPTCSDERYVIEDPFFVNSGNRNILQLADCVAYCVRRKFRAIISSDDDLEFFDDMFNFIQNKIQKHNGCIEGYGIVFYPTRYDSIIILKWHRGGHPPLSRGHRDQSHGDCVSVGWSRDHIISLWPRGQLICDIISCRYRCPRNPLLHFALKQS